MGLPQIDFRVPEGTWLKSALAGRFGTISDRIAAMPGLRAMPSLRGTGALAWPYKIAVVAVMALVACGTLVTFGSATAETPSASANVAALPGSDEANPIVEGQVLPPPSPALLNSADLLASLNLTDYSPDDTTTFSLSDDDDDDNDSDDDEDTKSDIRKKLAAADAKPTPKPTKGAGSPTTSPEPTEQPKPSPTPSPDDDEEEVEGPKHKAWSERKDKYDDCREDANAATVALCPLPGGEPPYTS